MNLYRVKGHYSTVSETVGEIVQSTANENLQAMLWAIMQLGFQRHSQTINAVIFWAVQETLKSTWRTVANTIPQKRPICKKEDLWNCYRTWDAINCIDKKILFFLWE